MFSTSGAPFEQEPTLLLPQDGVQTDEQPQGPRAEQVFCRTLSALLFFVLLFLPLSDRVGKNSGVKKKGAQPHGVFCVMFFMVNISLKNKNCDATPSIKCMYFLI